MELIKLIIFSSIGALIIIAIMESLKYLKVINEIDKPPTNKPKIKSNKYTYDQLSKKRMGQLYNIKNNILLNQTLKRINSDENKKKVIDEILEIQEGK
jgi:hypothetical protein